MSRPPNLGVPTKRICFISLKSYDLLAETPNPKFIGGAERQQVLIARGLQMEGYEVSFVTLDEGQPDGMKCKGITIHNAYRSGEGLPMLRSITPRWTGLVDAMRRANADVYHQMCADSETGQVALWCRSNGRRFLFAVASDADCVRELPLLRSRRQRWLYRFGLGQADRVVVQTESQKSILEREFGIRAMQIRSCTVDPGPPPSNAARVPKASRPMLVWVSRIVALKRLEWVLDVAESCPSLDFVIVGGGDPNDPYVRDILNRGSSIPNVKMMGRVADSVLWEVYERADLLVDTAAVAGVPTTFLEAWARGVPVVSTVDPDGIVARYNLGRVVTSRSGMNESILELLNNANAWFECSTAGRKYYEDHHTVKAVVRAYRSIIEG